MKVLWTMCLLALASCDPKVVSNEAAPAIPSENDISETGGSSDLFDSNKNTIDINEMPASPEETKKMELAFARGDKVRAWQDKVRPTPRNAFPPIGRCYYGRIKDIDDDYVLYTNGLNQLPDPGYNAKEDRAIAESHIGDKVRMCVVALPDHCPAGDFRGITYRAHNLRTGGEWEAGDSQHLCGGP